MQHNAVIDLIRDIFRRIAAYEGEIPGAASSAECGNYLEHDLAGAKEWAAQFLPVIENWKPENLRYPS